MMTKNWQGILIGLFGIVCLYGLSVWHTQQQFDALYAAFKTIPLNTPKQIFQPQASVFKNYQVVDPRKNTDTQPFLVKNGIIYSHYRKMQPQHYVFHPCMVHLDKADQVDHQLQFDPRVSLNQFAVTLPNRGSAFYFDKTIRNARMTGPYYQYSAICQGYILAALGQLHQQNAVPPALPWIQKVVQSFYLPVEAGGVNFADKALLEFPIYTASPEIILNGWMSALINLKDIYTHVLPQDARLQSLLNNNFQFLAQSLPLFDDEAHQLSRYSNSSPYQVHLIGQNAIEHVQVLYLPRFKGLPTFKFSVPIKHGQQSYSRYDTYMSYTSTKRVHAVLRVLSSQHYDVRILVDQPSIIAYMDPGRYNRTDIYQKSAKRKMQIVGYTRHEQTLFNLEPYRRQLFAGQPTNFNKRGKNFYHIYHIVALGMLGYELQESHPKVSTILQQYAKKWDGYVQKSPDKAEFVDSKPLFLRYMAHRMAKQPYTFEQMMAFVRQ